MNADFSQYPAPGTVYFHRGPTFSNPFAVRSATCLAEVWPALEWARSESAAGRCIAGYLAYEAAPAFDTAFAAHPAGELPLLWLGSYSAPTAAPYSAPASTVSRGEVAYTPGITEADYATAFADIRQRIGAGETYQVNYTFPLTADAPPDAWAYFHALLAAQEVPHAAYLDLGRWQVLSLSPELFFQRSATGLLRTKPMKGTHPRGPFLEADLAARKTLAESAKDRAENVMITDMLRNDMAKVSAPGSVAVKQLFEIERYATVWQMTSTIESQTSADVLEILRALFPSGSVTGAP